MEIGFTNGAFVHRLYKSGGAPELLGVFQYDLDAHVFARTKLTEDAERSWFDCFYAVTDARTAEMKTLRHAEQQS